MYVYHTFNNLRPAILNDFTQRKRKINSVLFTCNRFRERLHSFYPRYSFFI
jgi:hypothetical protein